MPEFPKEFLADFHDPFPVQKQMSNDRGGQGNSQPFMDRVTSEMWVGYHQEPQKDDCLEDKVDFCCHDFLLFE